MQYRNRIADRELEFRLESFGATLIVGPKGCGKTTTAKQKAASVVELQDEDKRDNYLAVAATQPSRLLEGPKPRLFDEWQDARNYGALFASRWMMSKRTGSIFLLDRRRKRWTPRIRVLYASQR